MIILFGKEQERIKNIEAALAKIEAVEGASDSVYDILTAPYIGDSETRRGNRYRSYESAVDAIWRKYHNTDRWGCGLTRGLIDWRVAQIAGNGANIYAKDKRTRDYLEDCFDYNGLFGSGLNDMVRDGEMEGRGLEILEWDKKTQLVKNRHVSWLQYRYTVKADPEDYANIQSVSFKDSTNTLVELTGERGWIFWKTSGCARNYDDTPPRIAAILTEIEEYDQALSDIRQNHRLFGYATPTLKTDTPETAVAERQTFFGRSKKVVWKIGRFLISSGAFSFVEPSGRAVESVKGELVELARKIQFVAGCPLHYIGFPDLMSNRAVAEDTNELVNASTVYERGVYEETLTKMAIQMVELYNENNPKSQLSTDDIQVTIPIVSMSAVKVLVELYLQLYDRDALTKQTLLSLVPNIDPEQEIRMLEKDKKKATDQMILNQDILGRRMQDQSQQDPQSQDQNQGPQQ